MSAEQGRKQAREAFVRSGKFRETSRPEPCRIRFASHSLQARVDALAAQGMDYDAAMDRVRSEDNFARQREAFRGMFGF